MKADARLGRIVRSTLDAEWLCRNIARELRLPSDELGTVPPHHDDAATMLGALVEALRKERRR